MLRQQEQVYEFHEKHDRPRSRSPRLVPMTLTRQRWEYMSEELDEYIESAEFGDLIGIADALSDLLYVVLGTAVTHGLDLEPLFDEVHRSNMTKAPLDPVTGKGDKGPDYQPPDLAPLLMVQGELPFDEGV